MLKYIIAFCIVSFCESASQSGGYHGLVLVQRFAITPVFYQQVHMDYAKRYPDKLQQYLVDHRIIFESKSWVVYALWPYDSNGDILTECVDYNEKSLTITNDSLDNNLRKLLRTQWPTLRLSGDEVEEWVEEYNTFGTCVSNNALNYFFKGLYLLNNHNLGNILDKVKVYPGSVHEYYKILNFVEKIVGTQICMKCMQSPGEKRQYLLEIHICFNSVEEVTDCKYQDKFDIHQCAKDKWIHYPLLPEGYL